MSAPRYQRGRAGRPQRGFTLIELLVSFTLLSVLMLAMVSALRATGQTEERVDARLARIDEMRTATQLLRSVLSQVSAQRVNAADGRTLQFAAADNELAWVGVMPARPGMGGRYFFRLAPETLPNQGMALVLRYAPWDSQATGFPAWGGAESRVIVPRLTGFSVQAQALHPAGSARQGNWPRGFQAGWPVPDALPEVVRIAITDAQSAWPDLVVAVRPTARSDASLSPFVVGGTDK